MGPELIVIHSISLPPGDYGGPWIDELFCGRLDPAGHDYFAGIAHLRVSAHLLIRRDGSLKQYVSFLDRAWHAGVSRYQGRSNCNDFSVGIELEGTDQTPFTRAQYHGLSLSIRALARRYPGLNPVRIVGHEHVAPGRKTDPGTGFDWIGLGERLQALGLEIQLPDGSTC